MTQLHYGIIMVLCTIGFTILAGAQQPVMNSQPTSTDPKGPEYRIGVAGHSKKGPCELQLFISVDPSHFVREDMLALAKRLNKDFHFETRLTAVILDDYNAARHPLRNTRDYRNAERGKYYLDRDGREQYIKFSTTRGKPWNEVMIDLNAKTK